jgi:hypothetical protein
MHDIENLKSELEKQFPEFSFRLGRRIYGKCIIAKKSKYSGADIYLTNKRIIVEPSVPEMKTRLVIGAGALFLKYFNKDFSEPASKIKAYLSQNYEHVALRR